jgi:hypothetical protein
VQARGYNRHPIGEYIADEAVGGCPEKSADSIEQKKLKDTRTLHTG